MWQAGYESADSCQTCCCEPWQQTHRFPCLSPPHAQPLPPPTHTRPSPYPPTTHPNPPPFRISLRSVQGWEFAHSLIANLLICSFCSNQMSASERIAQRKWANVSQSLRSLKTNEGPWAICSGRSEEIGFTKKFGLKKSKTLFFSMFYIWFFILTNERIAYSLFSGERCECSLRLPTKNERCERIAQVAHQKWVTMSDSLRSLRGNERCEWIAHFAHEKWANERFAQKMLAKKI